MAHFRPGLPVMFVKRIAMAMLVSLLACLWLAAAVSEASRAITDATGGTAAAAGAVADAMGRTTHRFLALTPSFGAADLTPGARMRSTTELLRVQAAFDAASAVFLVDASGHVVVASSPLPGGTLDVGASDWFRTGMRGGRDTVSAARVEASWLRPGPGVVLTRVLTRADGTPLGLIGALLPAQPAAGQPAPDWTAPDWIAPGWAPAGALIEVVGPTGDPIVSATAGVGSPPSPAGTDKSWGGRAFVQLGGLLNDAPDVTSAAPVPYSNLRVVARLPREATLLRAWPTSRPRLEVLGSVELALLGAGLLMVLAASRVRPGAAPATEEIFGIDWSFEVDQDARLASVAGFAPDVVRQAVGQPISALVATELSDAIARRLRGEGDSLDQVDGVVVHLPEGGDGTQVHRIWLRPQAGGSWRGAGRNITRETEAAARAKAAELAEVAGRQQLAELALERDRVLSAVGHDVRTPMNSILGICSLLLEGELEDDQRIWITRMRASCEALLAMLNGLLEIASLDSGAATLQVCEVDVADLVREVAETLTPQANDKGLTLAVRQDEALAGLWVTDPTRLRQILFNLVGNAIKYTSSGKVDVRTAVMSGADGQTSIRITVADSGPGIAPEERGRIFDRFKRGEAELGHGGLGLGLALCRDIADLMGGTLAVESTRGVGSEFTFVVPAERMPDRYEQMPYAGRTCVVIGFVGELQSRLPERLAALGFTVEYAPDGFVGFGLVERTATQRGALDLVVLDGALMGMNPAHLARRLQAATFSRTARLLGVLPEGGDAAELFGVVDALVVASDGSAAIARAAGELVGSHSPLVTLGAGMAEAASQRVLIVEDNKINQALLSAALGRRGFTTFVTDNGEDAVRILAHGGFDAVLMDIQMPGIDGLEATRRIRNGDTPSSAIPIIALTAFSGGLIQRRCDEAGVTAIVEKPVNVERLGHMLRTWIAQGGAARSPAPEDDGDLEDEKAEGALGEMRRTFSVPDRDQRLLHEDDDNGLEEEDDDTEIVDVSDVFLECLVADIGLSRAQTLVEAFGRDAAARNRQLQELLPAWEVGSIARICHDLHGVAATLGAVGLSECLEALADAAERGARDEAGRYAEQLDEILIPTLSILTARLAGMDDLPPGQNPRAA
jgi:signal transduction histidine kinase/CheY-like chemotaxis protein